MPRPWPRRRAPGSAAPPPDLPIDRHVVDILIEGVSRGDPAFDNLEFMLSPQSDKLPELWRAHRAALLKEAARRGIRRPCWGAQSDTEDA